MAIGAAMLAIASCASMGTPSGGPRDEDPPIFVTSTPLQGEVEVTPTRAVLTFNELVTLKDAFTKVVLSPPASQVPRVSSLGRRVIVDFRDSLLPNTTYTIDFGDAIADNNEGNKLENFIYTFSTGPTLDSLMVSGMVLGAQDLEPAKGVYVGLHSNLQDSAFKKSRFDRIAKTDDYGKFVIGGLPAGEYRIYALEDRDGDMAWSSPEESLAFYSQIIVPTAEEAVASDTIYNLLTGEIDTVKSRNRVKFLPNNILLRSYNTGFKQQYITKYERIDSTRINILLNAAEEQLPRLELVGTPRGSVPVSEVAVIEKSATNDTLSLWLKDRDLINNDTLRLAIEYHRADSLYNLQPVNDTLRLLTQRKFVKPTKAQKTKKKGELDSVPEPVPTFDFKLLSSRVEVNAPMLLEVPVPLEEFNRAMVRLETKEDSLYFTVAGFGPDNIAVDSLNPRKIIVSYPWEYDTSYRLTVDSLAALNIHGIFSDDLQQDFTTRKESDYGSLQFNISGITDSIPRFVDLLDSSEKRLRSLPVENGKVLFEYLLPATYTVRIVEDFNGNGRWDPGNFEQGIGPDLAYYYPEAIELKQNWSQEIDWNVFATPVDKMKAFKAPKKKP